MQQSYPFQPSGANQTTPDASRNLAVTASPLTLTLQPVPAEGGSILLNIVGTQTVFWCYGTNANLTVNNGIAAQAGSTNTFSLPGGISALTFIAGATGSTAYVSVGMGS